MGEHFRYVDINSSTFTVLSPNSEYQYYGTLTLKGFQAQERVCVKGVEEACSTDQFKIFVATQ